MKKLKFLILSAAIVMGIGGAWATKPCSICEYYDQYRLVNGAYVYAGTYGVTYICSGSTGICTYYRPTASSGYVPCQVGDYFQIVP